MPGVRRARVRSRGPGATALALSVFAVACGGSNASPTAPSTARSTVYAFLSAGVNPAVLAVGETGLASVTGWTIDANERIYGPIPVSRWTSSNTAVATVTDSRVVTAQAPGTATLTATSDGGTFATTVSVYGDGDIEELEVTCVSPVLVTQVTSCQAQVRTRYGKAAVRAAWTSSTPEVASLVGSPTASTGAFLNANSTGQTTVTATHKTFRGSTTVEVRR